MAKIGNLERQAMEDEYTLIESVMDLLKQIETQRKTSKDHPKGSSKNRSQPSKQGRNREQS
jgi:hypothetical protein